MQTSSSSDHTFWPDGLLLKFLIHVKMNSKALSPFTENDRKLDFYCSCLMKKKNFFIIIKVQSYNIFYYLVKMALYELCKIVFEALSTQGCFDAVVALLISAPGYLLYFSFTTGKTCQSPCLHSLTGFNILTIYRIKPYLIITSSLFWAGHEPAGTRSWHLSCCGSPPPLDLSDFLPSSTPAAGPPASSHLIVNHLLL